MERRQFLTTLLASSVALGATSAFGREREWKGWGFDPYARSIAEALSPAKIDKFFADAQDPRVGMPQAVVDKFKQLIRDHPQGTTTYIVPSVPGQKDTILLLMESGSGPMYHLPVHKFAIAYGVVKAAEARAWAVNYGGVLWEVGFPLICRNWTVLKREGCGCAPVPPPRQPCVMINISMHAGATLHGTLVSVRDLPPTDCGPALKGTDTDVFIPTNDRRFQRPCDDWEDRVCSFAAPTQDLLERGFRGIQRPGYSFNYRAPTDGHAILRLPPVFAEQGSPYIYLFCLTENRRLQSEGKYVTWREMGEYQGAQQAFVIYDPRRVPQGEVERFRYPEALWDVPSHWDGPPLRWKLVPR